MLSDLLLGEYFWDIFDDNAAHVKQIYFNSQYNYISISCV